MKKIVFILFILLGVSACKNSSDSDQNLTREISFKKQGELILKKSESDSIITTLDIEIADNDYKTQTGLMYRSSMESNQAMLFIFPQEQPRSFYMKNTEFSIDIIYFDKNRKLINLHKNAEPYSEKSLPSAAPAKYVLEVKAGLSETWNLQPGDRFEYSKK